MFMVEENKYQKYQFFKVESDQLEQEIKLASTSIAN